MFFKESHRSYVYVPALRRRVYDYIFGHSVDVRRFLGEAKFLQEYISSQHLSAEDAHLQSKFQYWARLNAEMENYIEYFELYLEWSVQQAPLERGRVSYLMRARNVNAPLQLQSAGVMQVPLGTDLGRRISSYL